MNKQKKDIKATIGNKVFTGNKALIITCVVLIPLIILGISFALVFGSVLLLGLAILVIVITCAIGFGMIIPEKWREKLGIKVINQKNDDGGVDFVFNWSFDSSNDINHMNASMDTVDTQEVSMIECSDCSSDYSGDCGCDPDTQ